MKRILTSVFSAIFALSAATVFAKTINLYSEAKTDSKVISTLNTEAGVTIVYTPKNSEWIKVANPANGDVGWVKSSDLGGNHYNMRVITSGDGSRSYSVYQFGGNTNQYTQQQIEKEMQQLEQQQRLMQTQMSHMFNDMLRFSQPLFVPVVMVPVKANDPKASSAKPNSAVTTAQPAVSNKK